MNCRQINELIELFVLGELDQLQRTAVKIHLSTCAICRNTESECRLAIAKIRQSTKPDFPGIDFNRKLRLAVDAEISKTATGLLFRRIVTVASMSAACLLFGMLIWHFKVYPAIKGTVAMEQPTISRSLSRSLPNSATISTACRYASSQSTTNEFIIRNRNMYLIDDNLQAKILAIDIGTGRKEWYSDIKNCGNIAADDSRVYCLAKTGRGRFDLVAISGADGQLLWRYPQECFDLSQPPCRPTVLPGERICWVFDRTIHVLKASNGKVLWTHSIPEESLLSAAVVKGNSLYVAGSEGIYCLNTASGAESWRLIFSIEMDKKIKPLLAISDTHLYTSLGIPNAQSILLSVGIAKRKVTWAKTTSNVSHLYVAGDKLYFRNGSVHTLDRLTGETLWTYASEGHGPITRANGRIYFIDSDEGLIALYEQTGDKLWQLAGMCSCDAFVKIGSIGYIRTREGVIHKIIFKG